MDAKGDGKVIENTVAASVPARKITMERTVKGKIKTGCREKRHTVGIFLVGTAILTVAGFLCLDVDWLKIFSRVPDIGTVFWKLAHLSFSDTGYVLEAMAETISIAVLSTIYSLVLGLIFGMAAAENIFRFPALSVGLKSFFTFLRAVPTPVWVLLMLVCLGFGPTAGIAGLCVHTTAFFTKSFAQSFEDIPTETIEALEATGANKLQIFFGAVLPAALSQIVAWTGMRFEINFAECAILGMVGAGGVGFVISTSIQGYEYGKAGLAILLVFLFAYLIERMFVNIKKRIK